MRTRFLIFITALFYCLVTLSACQLLDQKSGSAKSAIDEKNDMAEYRADDPLPHEDADLPPGPLGDGRVIIPNGRLISPLGNQIAAPRFISSMIVSPDSRFVYLMSLGDRKVAVLDAVSLEFVQEIPLRDVFIGLALNAAGDKLWVSGGGANLIFEYDVTDGVLTENRTIPVAGFPMGIRLSPDESTLYVAAGYASSLFAVNLADGAVANSWICQNYPYEIVLDASGETAYVSNWGSESVTVIDIAGDAVVDHVPVGKNPEGLALKDGKLYAASSDEDVISVIDTEINTVVDEILLTGGDDYFGYMPTHMDMRGDDLYLTCSGFNSVVVIDTTTDTVRGHIPTGWYPMAVAVDPAGDITYVANAKGEGHGPGGGASGQLGTIGVFDAPALEDFVLLTQEVQDNNARTANFYSSLDFESPIPTERGVASQQIKRVVFVLKENKTYDQILGDLEGTEADPELCVFCGDYTPNTHALARRFANCDNFYSETEASLMGHMWGTALLCNDYIEKGHEISHAGWLGMTGIEPAGRSAKGSIFQHLLNHDIPFRSYGQAVNTIVDLEKFYPYVSLQYGFWNLGVSDEKKIDIVIRDMEAGVWPPLVYISLPNDHAAGSDPGTPTPASYVADNDAALGKLIDYISHSPYWNETAIFVTQDDPQSGADHISAHRTLGLAISPWAKNHTSHTLYSMSSIWLTTELILGIPSLTHYDKNVAPMYDCFTMTPDNTPYDAIARIIPIEYNAVDAPFADWSKKQVWDVPDQIPNMGEIIWAIMRPNDKFPFHLSVDVSTEEIAEERKEAIQYRKEVAAWSKIAMEKGIIPLSQDLFVHKKNK
jgi:YVTN family beta-propeller protein